MHTAFLLILFVLVLAPATQQHVILKRSLDDPNQTIAGGKVTFWFKNLSFSNVLYLFQLTPATLATSFHPPPRPP